MPLQFSSEQMQAFDTSVVTALARRLTTAAEALLPDLSAEAAEGQTGGLLGFMTEVCEHGYAIGLTSSPQIAAFAGLCLCEARLAPQLPRLFAQLENVLSIEGPGDLLMDLVDKRLAESAEASPVAAEIAKTVRMMREAV